MAPTAFEKDVADREGLKQDIEFMEQEVAAHQTTALTYPAVELYLQDLVSKQKELEINNTQMQLHAPRGTDMAPYKEEYYNIRKTAMRVFNGLHGIKASLPAPAVPTPAPVVTPSTSGSSQQTIKFPKMDLKKFSGNLQEWISFRDTFETTVDKSTLSKVQKLALLKSLLEGEAERQIRSIILSDANYDIAWKALQERYENSRELLFSILKRLIFQPSVTTGSAQGIRNLIDTTKECIRSLEVLLIPTQYWDAILIYLLFTKIDSNSKELWEQSLVDTSIPSLAKMYEFLEQRARALAASSVPAPRQQAKPHQASVKTHHVSTSTCKFGCTSPHPHFRCPTFRNQTPQQRTDAVKRHNLCFNCLQDGHSSSSCTSNGTCKVCGRKHHTMLHLDGGKSQQQPSSQQASSQQVNTKQPAVTNHHVTQPGFLQTGILATARLMVINNGRKYLLRSLIDPGSTNSYVTEKTARSMNLQLRPCNISMTGLSAASVGTAKYVTSFAFTSHFKSMNNFSATALVVKKISSTISSATLKRDTWNHLTDLELADPEFHIPHDCDVLLGTDVCWSVLENEKIGGGDGQPFAIKSSLGWLVAGPNSSAGAITIFNTVADLDYQLQRFWEQESITEETKLSKEESECESNFQNTHKRDSTGRFIVSLPFKKKPSEELGSSRQAAIKRFISMEKKFTTPRTQDMESLRKLTTQWSQYKEFMSEYESLGHMCLVPADEVHTEKVTYYIPHHSVLKESSTTTKLRVVFDASAPTSSGTSLNQCMMIGPSLQDPITDIMLRFRIHPIAFTADIAKMYRQILVNPDDTDLQRIVWREHPSLPLRDYKFLTVTYGTTSAPYLAVKCLQQLAKDEQTRYPDAAKVALRDFYVDDTASGCQTLDEAKKTVQQLMDLSMSGGFELRKWTTNSAELLNYIPEELRETSSLIQLQEDMTVKTLGVFWNPCEDKYLFRLTLPPDMPGNYSKRLILSEIARIFDPLGWLAPAIIVCKMFMQDLWKIKLDWDEPLSATVQEQWLSIKSSLSGIERIEIPRCVSPGLPIRRILVGCSDASIKAISACVYICCEYEDQDPSCYLLTSKTKVAPVKHVTLPRLELNGAVLLSELLQTTLHALQLEFSSVRAFTDSTITLHWITSSPTRWKPYIRRRVQSIQDNVPTAEWFHIPGDRNPADCASRGITAEDLHQHQLWWNGVPEFLNPPNNHHDLQDDELQQVESEIVSTSHHVQPQPVWDVLTKFQSFSKLQRIIAYCLRFIHNARRGIPTQSGSLSTQELKLSHDCILRQLQRSSFAVEYELLTKQTSLPITNSLVKLQPFIGEDGLLRVGGRLRHSQLPFYRKHPILLPRNHHVTTTIIRDVHTSLLHAGPSATLATLHHKYWITNGRDNVRLVLRKCVTCARQQATMMKQVMADLPSHRVTPARPFSKVGVDYAGPISIRPMTRSRVSLKCWLSIFVCLSTRATHIEVVSSLSSDCFLAALRRFISRRGKPTDIFSDCGTNFKGTDKVLRDFVALSKDPPVQNECTKAQITWHFNPPGAPHFGGLWEAGVKSIKYHLKPVMGSSLLTYEELHTLVVQIEGILNSRPLVPVSADPGDLEALTPAHFLIGSSITSPPEPSLVDAKEGHLKRWQLIQQRQQLFWKRWSSEYISRLQQRPKWHKPTPNLEVGHLVIIKDERLPPLKWKLGRVIAVHPGNDGHVRVATLKTSEGETKRPIVKLSLLPIPISEN